MTKDEVGIEIGLEPVTTQLAKAAVVNRAAGRPQQPHGRVQSPLEHAVLGETSAAVEGCDG